MKLFGLKRIEATNVIFFSFYIQSLVNRDALQASNQKRHIEAEERKVRQLEALDASGQADGDDVSTTANNKSRSSPQKQPKPISRKRRIYYIALIDNNFGIGNLFLTLDLSDDVVERAERKLRTFLNALVAYYAQLGFELKWICTREFGKRGTKRKHFHLIINGTRWTVDINKIKNLWKYGKISAEEITQAQIDNKRAELDAKGNAFAKDLNEIYSNQQGECYVESITRVEGALAVYLAKDFDNTHREYRMRTFTHSENLIEPDIVTEYLESQDFNKLLNGYREGGQKKVRDIIEDECKKQGVNYVVPELPYVRDQEDGDPRPPYISWVCNKGVSELNRHAWDKHTPVAQDISDRDIDEIIEPIVK